MTFDDLRFVSVFTGITFGRECYLNRARAEELVDKINNTFHNLFPRYEILTPRHPISMINVDDKCECVISPRELIYRDYKGIPEEDFLKIAQGILKIFMDLFALHDVRRIGKVYDFNLSVQSPQEIMRKAFTRFDEELEIGRLHSLFRQAGKNININFFTFQGGRLEIFGGETEIDIPGGLIIRCDINNIKMDEPLEEISKTFEEIFAFADEYIKTGLIELLDKYLGDVL